MEVIFEAPAVTAFVPLIEHQCATPSSFYSGPPVLHYHSQNCKVIVLEDDVSKSAAIQRLVQGSEKVNANKESGSNGDSTEKPPGADEISAQVVVCDVDVWVTSVYVISDCGDALWLTVSCSENCSSIRLRLKLVFQFHIRPSHYMLSSRYQRLLLASNKVFTCSFCRKRQNQREEKRKKN